VNKPAQETAVDLIESTVYDLRVDAAYLRMHSREQMNEKDAAILRAAAEQLSRLSARLERATKSFP
jgi:hypothetical protein